MHNPTLPPRGPGERVVTPQQLSQGWLLLVGGARIHRSFRVIRKLSDGNYVVAEPQVEQEILSDGTVRRV